MEVTKPYQFIRFGAMEVTKPYQFMGFGAMDATKPYHCIGFGAMDVTRHRLTALPDDFTTGIVTFRSLPGPKPGS